MFKFDTVNCVEQDENSLILAIRSIPTRCGSLLTANLRLFRGLVWIWFIIHFSVVVRAICAIFKQSELEWCAIEKK